MRTHKLLKRVLFAGAAAVTLYAVAAPARADNISAGTWYAFAFTSTGSPLLGDGAPGTNPNGVSAPAAPWVITLAAPADLTVVDVELSGDQFELFNNGVSLGDTSTPIDGDSCGEDIGCVLGNSFFSQGTFLLPAGTDSITGTFLGGVGFGDGDFIVETAATPAPEPATLALFGTALVGLGAMRRRKRKTP